MRHGAHPRIHPPEDHTTAADITAVEVDADELEAQARSRFRLPDVT